MFGGRYAKPPVIHVEVGTQVDLLAYDEELVDDLNSGIRSFASKDCDRQGGRPDRAGIWICGCTGHSMRMLTTLRGEAHGEAELVTIQRGAACG